MQTVARFIELCAQADDVLTSGEPQALLTDTAVVGSDAGAEDKSSLPGLCLFTTQTAQIANAPAASNPLFLSVLLRAIRWSAQRGYDIWALSGVWQSGGVRFVFSDRLPPVPQLNGSR